MQQQHQVISHFIVISSQKSISKSFSLSVYFHYKEIELLDHFGPLSKHENQLSHVCVVSY